MTYLSVYRSPDIAMDRNRLYKIYVDGKPKGEVWPGQTAEVRVEPGLLRVQVQIDIYRSNELVLRIEPGSRTELLCHGHGVWRNLLAGLVKWHSYLVLEIKIPEQRAVAT
jgi:hypothetical protein